MPGYSLDNEKVSALISARYRSLREAAKAMGISHSYLSKILAGKREPGKKFIDGILVALKGVKYEEIFVETEMSGNKGG